MEGFRNFTRAMDRASDMCSLWKSADDGTLYSYAELMLTAAYLDRDHPLEERQWYIVFPDGEICLLHEDFEEIMPLWIPFPSKPVTDKLTGDEFYPEEKVASGNSAAESGTGEYKFCVYCGNRIPKTARFCTGCGKEAIR